MQARDDHKRQIAQYWKNEQAKIIKALNEPLMNETSGISDMDWEINVTNASRHQSNINKQSATIVINPKVRISSTFIVIREETRGTR